jgi:enterochelin esterase family protein
VSRVKIIFITLLLVIGQSFAQSQFQEFIQHLYQLPTIEAKEASIDSFMNYARNMGIPFIENDKANFVYNGTASSVAIAGDFNGWNPTNSKFVNMSGTKFFFRTETFEVNARLDYKLVINNSSWILDPENPNTVSGGFGPNSELAMPEYVQPWEIVYKPSIKHGERTNITVQSNVVGRSYAVSVYLPPSYKIEKERKFPTVYFQDGGEYITLGSSVNVIENLIDSNKICEIIAVFVTPNNRGEEYAFAKRMQYAEFFATELVPFIDSNYRTSKAASDRLVMGDSYGGNISGLISYKYPEVFGNCGLHSAAFQPNNYEVYNMIVNGEKKNIKYAGSWGTYEGLSDIMRSFDQKITEKGYPFTWSEYPEGHSWGLWRATTDIILESIFPYGYTSVKETGSIPDEFELMQNYPNPFNPSTTISYNLKSTTEVKIEITDTLGQRIKLLVNEVKSSGSHQVNFDGSNLSSGVYIYSITANGKTLSKKMELIK